MSDQEEKKDTKEPDETKNTTTETTPQDQDKQDKVDILVEKTLATEKKMTPEAKTALMAAVLSLFSIICLGLIARSNQENMVNLMTSAVFVAVIGGLIIALISTLVLFHKSKEAPPVMIGLLWFIFVLPFVFLTPLSRYHNQNCLERDKKIVEVLKITGLKDGVEVLLPSKHISDNNYLEKVFSIGWEEKNYPWKTTAIYCQKGKKIWYEIKLPFQGVFQKGKEIVLYFNHAWYDYEITKEISFPDPNSL